VTRVYLALFRRILIHGAWSATRKHPNSFARSLDSDHHLYFSLLSLFSLKCSRLLAFYKRTSDRC
jgi:hypothetical protein